jgi:Peptidase family M23
MPEPLVFLVILVVVPLLLMGWLLRREYASRLEALVLVTFTGMLVLFLLQWGQYPYVGSYYLRYVPVALVGGTTFLALRAARDRPWFDRPALGKGVLIGLHAVGVVVLVVVNWMAFRAHAVDVATVDMQFPLRGGIWYISTGGSNAVLNLHHKPRTPSQHYAIDIDRLDSFGRYARGLIPSRVEDYLIFGDTIFSPCAGAVLEIHDGMPDHKPFEYDSDSGGGNRVVLDCDGLEVALLHMMEGSVRVEPGSLLSAGDPLGRVGNSGFSVQPHLHVQASRTAGAQGSARRVGVPIRFGGRFLVRNELFVNE